LTSNYNSHITDNILRVGLNYRWAARQSETEPGSAGRRPAMGLSSGWRAAHNSRARVSLG